MLSEENIEQIPKKRGRPCKNQSADYVESGIGHIGTHSNDDEKKPLETIEEVDFLKGNDKLTIRFSKKHNRMFRIQIFLNNEIEVRPVTYTGARTGYSFWNLLKGAMQK